MEAIKTFSHSFKLLKEDRVLLILSLIPIFIGLIFYGLLGGWIFSYVIPWGNEIVQGWFSIDWLGNILGWIVKTFITILFFFSVNWTFFLVVSLLAAPFNDAISSRVEKKINNKNLGSLSSEFSGFFKKIGFMIINESKKVFIIISLSIISLVLSFFPLLAPVTIFIQATLVAVNFLDYSWSRHNMPLRKCMQNYQQNFINNSLIGFIGFGLLSIPGVNLISLPILVIAFSVNFTKIKPSN